MITLTWLPFPESNVANYRVYRSLIGFVATLPSPAALGGLTLTLVLNGGAPQTVTFDGVLSAVDAINAVVTGGLAYLSLADGAKFLFRSDVRAAPGSVQIVGGTALTLLALTARTITEKSEDLLLATVPALVDPTAPVTYVDQDGALLDWYAVTTLDSFANESLKTDYRQPISSSGAVCVLEGLVLDLQGRRVADARIRATLTAYPDSPAPGAHVTLRPIHALSGPDGRYSLALLQGSTVRLEIPEIGLEKRIDVPAQQFAFVSDLLASKAGTMPTDAELGVI